MLVTAHPNDTVARASRPETSMRALADGDAAMGNGYSCTVVPFDSAQVVCESANAAAAAAAMEPAAASVVSAHPRRPFAEGCR